MRSGTQVHSAGKKESLTTRSLPKFTIMLGSITSTSHSSDVFKCSSRYLGRIFVEQCTFGHCINFVSQSFSWFLSKLGTNSIVHPLCKNLHGLGVYSISSFSMFIARPTMGSRQVGHRSFRNFGLHRLQTIWPFLHWCIGPRLETSLHTGHRPWKILNQWS
jgi:hypothetical protein